MRKTIRPESKTEELKTEIKESRERLLARCRELRGRKVSPTEADELYRTAQTLADVDNSWSQEFAEIRTILKGR